MSLIELRSFIFPCVTGLVLLAEAVNAAPVTARWQSIHDLPESALRRRIEHLPEAARETAMGLLHRTQPPIEDIASLQVDDEGGIYYEETFAPAGGATPTAENTEPVTASLAVPVSPFPAQLKFHSRPGAPNVIYLNFSGERVTGTAWNDSLGRTEIPAVAFSMDEDYVSFSDAEQAAIKKIWQRVSEDYAAFDIDVTTERPAAFGTRTAHALITRSTDSNGQDNPSSGSAGVAYLDVFGSVTYARYRPAWIYFNQLAKNESFIGEGVSHEVGHNFGLSHDGLTDGTEYYPGHGSGDTSWGPIMGLSYNRNVSQWSKGEYYRANNTQDDLAIISSKATYRTDDMASTFTSATSLKLSQGSIVAATTPETDPSNTNRNNKGVIERSNDVDAFSFVTGTGLVDLTVNPWVVPNGSTKGGNVDLVLELYSEGGLLLVTANPSAYTQARIQTNLTEGLYYLLIRSAGVGSPLASTPTGYTSYASAGQYFITGTVTPFNGTLAPRAQLQLADVTSPSATQEVLTVTYTDNEDVQFNTIDGADLRVTGPSNYDRMAHLLNVSPSANAPTLIATYGIDPPNGVAWIPQDNGVYTVWIQTNQVSDTEGDWVKNGQLGEFVVDVPVIVYSANMSVNPNWALQPLWQYGKPTVGESGPSAGFTGDQFVGYNLAGDYEASLSFKYATTPPIDCTEVSGLTLRFKRWLRTRNGDSALIQISTDGTTWTDLWASTRTVSDSGWVDAVHALPSWVDGTSSLRIRWGIGSGPSLQDTGWNIDDVEVVAGNRIDSTPPTAVLSVDDVRSGGSAPQTLRVTYVDETALRASSLDSEDLIIVSPNGTTNAAEFVLVDTPSDGSPRLATYQLAPPGGSWGPEDNGAYQVLLQEQEVSDTVGNTTSATTLGSFAVDISETFSLSVTVNNPQWGSTIPDGGLYEAGTVVSLEAIPTQYFQFLRWGGDASGSANPTSLPVTTNLLVQAYFDEILTINHPTPLWWLASVGIQENFETAVEDLGANGIPLWQSYIAGLDPFDPEAQLRLGVTVVPGSSDYVLTWEAVEGRVYSVERSTDDAAHFEPVLHAESLPTGSTSLTNSAPPSASSVFYRLRVEKP